MRQIIAHLKTPSDPNLLVGTETADDAGVYKISDEMALVQTVDFFTPIVDDPYIYGQIAAANALSDVYAMGGHPLTALNIAAFPSSLPIEVFQKILSGGQDKAREAGVVVLGGHTVSDPELKYGMAVTGLIHPQKIYTNKGAREGDALILTKPLGTGILTTAIKKKKASKESIEYVCHWMTQLNKIAAEIMAEFTIHACTDITGFGLTGHAFQLAQASSKGLLIESDCLPYYEEALYFAKKGVLTRADRTNRLYVKDAIWFERTFSKEWETLFFDPQTSGGLFISLPEEEALPLLKKFHAAGLKESRRIGSVFRSDRAILRFI